MGQFRLFRVDMQRGVRSAWRAVFLAVTALLLAMTICSGSAFADTHVSGIINANTTWSAAQSPYVIDTEVQVAYGATLTIEPGVEVTGGKLGIWGVLNASGNADAPVYFKSVVTYLGSLTSTEPAEIDLAHCLVEGGRLSNSSDGNGFGSLQVRDSVLVGVAEIDAYYPTSDWHVERNAFIRCDGVGTWTNSYLSPFGNVYIRNNLFYASTAPILNVISGGTSFTQVTGNTFVPPEVGQSAIALKLRPLLPDAAIDATGNYWGTLDSVSIAARIYDRSDDLNCGGYIPFTPFLTAADPSAPTLDLEAPSIATPEITEGAWYSTVSLPAAVVTNADLFRLGYSLDGGSWTPGSSVSEGWHTLTVTALDGFLNKSTRTLHVGVDRTPPSTSTVPPATVPSTLSLTASDNANGSGVSQTFYRLDGGAVASGAKVPLTTAGIHSIEFWSVDVAGNEESPHQMREFSVRLVKPALTKLTPPSGRRNVTVTLIGKNFGAKRATGCVKFGATKVSKYVSWSATRIKCRVPAKAKYGKLKVIVVTGGGTSSAKSFTVKR